MRYHLGELRVGVDRGEKRGLRPFEEIIIFEEKLLNQ